MNLDVLTEPFEARLIKQRKGPGGKTFDYVETHEVIKRLNSAFEGEWTFEVKDDRILNNTAIVKGTLTAAGQKKDQYGSASLDHLEAGDAFKSAASDALKKCATLFGVALDLYEDHPQRERQEEPQKDDDPASPGHIAHIKRLLENHKIPDELKQEVLQKVERGLVTSEANQMIKMVRKWAQG